MRKLTKIQIRDWLNEHGRDRDWLAEQCGVSKGTVDQWFAGRGFSDSALAAIDKLMQLDEMSARTESSPDETGLIKFTTAEFELLEKARAAVGNPPRTQFYRDAILQYIEELSKRD